MKKIDKARLLDSDMLSRIKDLCNKGLFEKHISAAVGIPGSTWEYWKKSAKEISDRVEELGEDVNSLPRHEKRLINFLEIVLKGRTHAIEANIDNILAAGKLPQYWKASAWYLARIAPNQYDTVHKIDHSGAVGVVNVDLNEEESKQYKENLGLIFPHLKGE